MLLKKPLPKPERIPRDRLRPAIIPPFSAVRFGLGREFAVIKDHEGTTIVHPDRDESPTPTIFRGASGAPKSSLSLDGYSSALDRCWYVLENLTEEFMSLSIRKDPGRSSSAMMEHYRGNWTREDRRDGFSRMSVREIGAGHWILPAWYSFARAYRVRCEPGSLITINTGNDGEIFEIDRLSTKPPSYSLHYSGRVLSPFPGEVPGLFTEYPTGDLHLTKNKPYVIGPGSPDDLSLLFGKDLKNYCFNMAPLSFCLTYEGDDSFLIEILEETEIKVSKTYSECHLNDLEIEAAIWRNVLFLATINPSEDASGSLKEFRGLIVDPDGKFIGCNDPFGPRVALQDYDYSLALRCDIKWEDCSSGQSPVCIFRDNSGVYAINSEGGLHLPKDQLDVVYKSAVRYKLLKDAA